MCNVDSAASDTVSLTVAAWRVLSFLFTPVAEKICHLLNISVTEFVRGLLSPRLKVGRETVTKAQNVAQVRPGMVILHMNVIIHTFMSLTVWYWCTSDPAHPYPDNPDPALSSGDPQKTDFH